MTRRRARTPSMAIALLVTASSAIEAAPAAQSLQSVAVRFFRGVYGCDPGVVDELASPDIVVTYPVFATLFGQPALRGRDAVRDFAERFCRKWADPEVVFHEAVSDEGRVVLVWSFSARDTEAASGEAAAAWGGISLVRFDAEGKITAEIGEESTPGPMGRLGQEVASGLAASDASDEPPSPSDNVELTRMFKEDQQDREPGLHGIDWSVVKPRDDARLERTRELYKAGALRTGADWLHAALILQHSSDPDDYLLAHEMCVAALALGEMGAKWLVAATEDRFLRAIGREQRFGTQYEASEEPGRFRLAPTDPRVTDELRVAVGAPPLAEAKATEDRFDEND